MGENPATGKSHDLSAAVKKLLREYPITPLTEPKHIKDEGSRELALNLRRLKKQREELPKPEYKLPDKPKFRDPRSLVRRIADYAMVKVFPEGKRAKVKRRIEIDRQVAEVQNEAAYLEMVLPEMEQVTTEMRARHGKVSEYFTEASEYVRKSQRKMKEHEGRITGNVEEMEKLQHDSSSVRYREKLQQELGNQAMLQAVQRLEEEETTLAVEAVTFYRINEFMYRLSEDCARYLPSCQATLAKLEKLILAAFDQKLHLENQLKAYAGLTEQQIGTMEAIDFLETTRQITDDLERNMTNINKHFHDLSDSYLANAPDYEPAPPPEEEEARLELMDDYDEE